MANAKVIAGLNQALEREMGNVIRYLHHSFLVRGVNRGPLVEFFRNQAQESFQHATAIGEKIVALGGHPCRKLAERVCEELGPGHRMCLHWRRVGKAPSATDRMACETVGGMFDLMKRVWRSEM